VSGHCLTKWLLRVFALLFLWVPLAWPSPFTTDTPAVYTFSNHKFAIFLPVKNTGKIEATDIEITSITLGNAKLSAPSLPSKVGNIDADQTAAIYLNFNDQTLVAGQKYLFTAHGTYVADGSKSTFTLTRTIQFGVPSVFQLKANPLTVVPSPDPTHTARAVISAANGGTLTTTGGDGTVFTFTLPANALLSDEEISMTPVMAVGGLPKGGAFVAGVEFQPEGLVLLQPGTLTMAPTTQPPTDQLLAYGYHNGGDDLHLEPLTAGSTLTLSVLHFSGTGWLYGDIMQEIVGVGMSNAIDSLQNALAGCGINPWCQTGVMQEFYDQVLVPTDNAAVGSDAYFGQAVGYTTIWLAYFAKTPLELFAAERNSAYSALLSILINFFNRAYTDCTQARAMPQVDLVHMLVSIELLVSVKQTVQIPNAVQKVEACIAGPLDFNFASTIAGSLSLTGAETLSSTSTVGAQMPLTFDTAKTNYTGSGTLNYQSYSFSDDWNTPDTTDCSSGVGNPGTIAVTATFDLNNITTLVPNPNQIRMQVTLIPHIDETDTLCAATNGISVSLPEPDAFYDTYFAITHGGTGFNGYPPSPYFLNLNTPQTFNFAGSSVVGGGGPSATYIATENSTLTLTQTSP